MATDSGPGRGPLHLLAHAKLNLSLRVLAREESGFHSIETILARLELADRLEIEATREPEIRLEVTGDSGVPADESNLAWRAAEALRQVSGSVLGASIRLEKRIPAGAGLGGGSADAAVVLSGLNLLFGSPLDGPDLVGVAGSLGSDVPFGLCPAPMALAWERGRRLLPLADPAPRPVLIVVPDYPVGAGDAYGWLADDRTAGLAPPPGAAHLPPPAALADPVDLAGMAVNDLEGPVFRRHPDLAGIKDSLAAQGAAVAVLCGSGSCVAGVFRDPATRDAAAESFEGVEAVRTISTRTLG